MKSNDITIVNEKIRPALEILIRNFNSGDYALRKESAIALSKFKGEMAATVLLQTYASDNIQDFMALALGNLENSKAVDLLVKGLNDSQSEVRFNAARALGMIKSDDAFNVLMEGLTEYADSATAGVSQGKQGQLFLEEEAIISAITALGKLKNPLSGALLKRILNQEKSARIRASIISSLGMMATERMLPIFQGAMRDEDPRVRANAIEAIENIKSASIVGILQPYLEDANNRVRANVAKAIWRFGDFDVTDTISKMLSSKEKWQRASGAFAMGEIKDVRFITKLAQALKDEDSDVRRNAAQALKKIQSPNALQYLIPLLEDPNFDVRVQAALAISRCNSKKIIELLVPRLKVEKNSIVRATIISSLGDTSGTEVITLIIPFLDDSDPRVIANSISAIQKLSQSKPNSLAIEKIKKLLYNEDNRVKSNSIHALWKWNEYAVLDNLKDLLTHQEPKHRLSGTFVLGEIGTEISEDAELSQSINELIAKMVESDGVEKGPTTGTSDGEKTQSSSENTETSSGETGEDERSGVVGKQTSDSTVKTHSEDAFSAQIELAGNYLKEKEYKEAEKIYLKILSQQPENLKAILGIGDLFFLIKQFSEASVYYEKALAINPNLVKAHYNLGTIYYFQKDFEQSINHLTKALDLYPKLLGAYLILAQIFQISSRTKESIVLLSRAVELAPRNPIIYQKLALLHLHIKQYDMAVKVLKKSVQLSPLDVESNVLLAYSFHLINMPEEAFTTLDAALSSCAQSPSPEDALRILLNSYNFIKNNIKPEET
ncbi:MAG: HEAT repeat domain-containing protein [Candidatus Riflebacteria bacterium]|nr:HEAT repeat domain-containing protein [Candidatus Riflebacteria bacterium]